MMKKLKLKTIAVALLLGLTTFSQAQTTEGKTKGKIVDPGPKMPRMIFSAGYGNTMPGSATKDAYFTNSSGISGDLFVPFLLFRKGWDGTVKGGNYGINIGGTYNFGGNSDPSIALPNGFLIAGQTASSIAYKGGDPRQLGFRIGGGPQANFYFGEHFTISPMVLAEYFSMTQKEISAVQRTQVNGQTKEYNLWTLPETKTTGLAITPKVRLRYMFTQNLGIFADGAYIFGPKINTQTSTLKPLGNPNQAGQYDQQQLDLATQVKSDVKSTSYQALSFNVGLSVAFGGRKGWNGITKTEDKGWNGVAKTSDKGWNGVTDINDKGWNGKIKNELKNKGNGGIPQIDSTGTTVWMITFSNGCKRVCSVPWTILSPNNNICSGEQTNLTCDISNSSSTNSQQARLSTGNIVYDKDGNMVTQKAKSDWGIKPPYSPFDPNPKPGDKIISLSFINAVCHLKPQCDEGGVLCISSPASNTNVGENQIMTRVNITKNNTKIIINSEAFGGTISPSNLEKFKNKKVPLVPTDIPFRNMKILFESIGLNCPENSNEFSASEISYKMLPNNIVEITQSKPLNIGNTIYQFIVTTKLLNRKKLTKEEEMELIKNTAPTGSGISEYHKPWTECNGSKQVNCHFDKGGNIISVVTTKDCSGSWSSY